jgi:putative oxidoreductase
MQPLDRAKPLGLLLLRWGLAIIFCYHGYPKLAKAHATMQQFVRMGFPSYFAMVSGILEVFGSLMLVIGLFTRVAALLLAGEMAVVIWRVDLARSGFYALGHYELPLALGVATFALATVGPGLISLDAALFGRAASSGRSKARARN